MVDFKEGDLVVFNWEPSDRNGKIYKILEVYDRIEANTHGNISTPDDKLYLLDFGELTESDIDCFGDPNETMDDEYPWNAVVINHIKKIPNLKEMIT